MNDTSTSANAFLTVVEAALARSGLLPPADGEVRVLLFDTQPFSAHAPSAHGLLDAAERVRAAQFRFERDRLVYIMAHATWRVLLAACLKVGLDDLPLVTAPSGQPQLPDTGMSTSLSHSGSWVAIAICGAESVGIDIEKVPPRTRLSELIRTICTPLEEVQLMALGETARETALLALWTRKEALLKAFGVGLAQAMTTLHAGVGELVAAPAAAAGGAPCWSCMLDLPAELVGALAVPADTTLAGLHWLELA
ncbi:MAG: 4'-phosphopantetheinyl transferase superfamily protein [Rhodanobacter sp.]